MDNRNDNIEFKLSQLLDGDLDPTEEALLLARLREDPELACTYAAYKHLDEMLEDLAVSPELSAVDYDAQRAEIMGQLEKKALLVQRPRIRIVQWAFGGALAAAAALLLAIGAGLFFQTHQPVTPPQAGESVASMEFFGPAVSGAVESSLGPIHPDAGDEVAMVQVRVIYPADDEFMLAAPEENPLRQGPDIAAGGVDLRNLPSGTVLMVQDRPTDRGGFDMFDIH